MQVGKQEHLLYGKPYIKERLRGLEFEISANSFFQTNTKQVKSPCDWPLTDETTFPTQVERMITLPCLEDQHLDRVITNCCVQMNLSESAL